MSRIIKASFQPIIGTNDYADEEKHQPFLPPLEPKTNGQSRPAAAIVDAAVVISTAHARATELLRQAEDRAVELMVAAEEQAAALRADAREAGFAAGQEAGYKEGYAAGHREGAAAIREELQREKAAIFDIVGECQQIRSRTIAQAERDVVVLSLAIAEKIIKKHVQNAPEETSYVVQEVVERLQQTDEGVIRVHPSVLKSLGQSRTQDGGRKGDEFAGFELVGDTSIAPGGCLVETEFGRLDARLETRMMNLSQALLQSLEGDGP